MAACFLAKLTDVCMKSPKNGVLIWGVEVKITKNIHTFSRDVCYNNKAKMRACVLVRGKGVPYE